MAITNQQPRKCEPDISPRSGDGKTFEASDPLVLIERDIPTVLPQPSVHTPCTLPPTAVQSSVDVGEGIWRRVKVVLIKVMLVGDDEG
jgi:hypothetical protein